MAWLEMMEFGIAGTVGVLGVLVKSSGSCILPYRVIKDIDSYRKRNVRIVEGNSNFLRNY